MVGGPARRAWMSNISKRVAAADVADRWLPATSPVQSAQPAGHAIPPTMSRAGCVGVPPGSMPAITPVGRCVPAAAARSGNPSHAVGADIAPFPQPGPRTGRSASGATTGPHNAVTPADASDRWQSAAATASQHCVRVAIAARPPCAARAAGPGRPNAAPPVTANPRAPRAGHVRNGPVPGAARSNRFSRGGRSATSARRATPGSANIPPYAPTAA